MLSQLDEVMFTLDNAVAETYSNRLSSVDADEEMCTLNPAENTLERMYKYYEDCKFCDVTLVAAGENEIKTHKLVLSSSSSYFSRLYDCEWQDSNLDRIEIEEFDEPTLRCMLDFVYTGKLQLNTSNVLRVLAACNFFQLFELEFIKHSIAKYLKEKVNENNCPALVVIAERFNAATLKELLVKYAARNFCRIVQEDDFLNLPVELLVEILQSNVVVDHGRDFLPPAEEQEDFILDFLLKYISHQSANDEQSDLLLSKLVFCIHFHCLIPSSIEKLCKYARNCSESLGLIMQAKKELIESKYDSDLIKLWGTERAGIISNERCCNLHAGTVNVGPIHRTFGDELFISENLYIQGMKLWIRSWDGHPVIGGLKVFYSNGESPMYGGDDDDSSDYEFHLDEDERIVKAEVRSGWMIDSLRFFTNRGRELGPYGGDGGNEYTEQPRGRYGFLSCVRGAVVTAYGKLGITELRLIWREYLLLHQYDSDEVDTSEHDDSSHSLRSSSYESESEIESE